LTLPNTGVQTLITTGNLATQSNYLVGTFVTSANTTKSTLIPAGNWSLGLYASSTATSIFTTFYFDIYSVDSDGVSNPVLIKAGSAASGTQITTTTISVYINSIYVPLTTLADLTKRIRIRLYIDMYQNNQSATFAFRDNSQSSLITTLPVTVAPVLGSGVGAIIVNSPTGSNNIYYSDYLNLLHLLNFHFLLYILYILQ
jgi:hypothetical protein